MQIFSLLRMESRNAEHSVPYRAFSISIRRNKKGVILSEAKDLRRNDTLCRWIGTKILRLRLRMTTGQARRVGEIKRTLHRFWFLRARNARPYEPSFVICFVIPL